MFNKIVEFFTGKKTESKFAHPLDAVTTPNVPQAPYKVETPAPVPEPAKCGCGRSSTGLCVGLHKLTAEEWAAHPDNPTKPAAATAKKTPAKKTPAKKAPAAKPAAIKAAPKTSTRRTKKPAQ